VNYFEEFTIERRPKMAWSWDVKMWSYFWASP